MHRGSLLHSYTRALQPTQGHAGEEEPPKKSELLASSHLTKGLPGGVAELIKVGEVYRQEEGGEEKQWEGSASGVPQH